MPVEGNVAPDFELPDQDGRPVQLSDYWGQRVVLYFYPMADTPGCTKEACSFRDVYDKLEKHGVAVFGVSTDTVEEVKAFAEKYDLPFRLLADPEGEVARRYDSFTVTEIRGEKWEVAERNTFLLDEEGTVATVYENVSPEAHAEDVLNDLAVETG